MDGIHDLGGMHGFGAPEVEDNEPVFHERWEGRAWALVSLTLGAGVGNVDKFRHAIERMRPERYLASSYYERWLQAVETLLLDDGVVTTDDLRVALQRARDGARPIPATSPAERPGREGAQRRVSSEPAFAVGDRVRAKSNHPSGHTRLPRYARGKGGVVAEAYPAFVLPDTNAHDLGECPQYVYAVLFDGRELWGEDGEENTAVSLDLFECYLEKDE